MIRTKPCCNGMSGSGMSGSWSETFQGMLESWSKAGQQILLNLNQPLQLETGPGGTRVYQTGAGTPGAVVRGQSSTPEGVIREGSYGIALLVVAGLVIYLIVKGNED